MQNIEHMTPQEAQYYFPAEWAPHQATWLSFPHNLDTWPKSTLVSVQKVYIQWINALSPREEVHVLVQDEGIISEIQRGLGAHAAQVFFHLKALNDAWIRDYGPGFLLHRQDPGKKAILNWQFNSWGGKYLPFEEDNACPEYIAQYRGIPQFTPPYILEGGSIEVNGAGMLLTNRECLLHPNRNPGISEAKIEQLLKSYYNVQEVIWLRGQLEGDDTDGHIDNLARFVSNNTILVGFCTDKQDPNYKGLQENVQTLLRAKNLEGKPFEIIKIPMPSPLRVKGQRLPASYLNFYIANRLLVLPQYHCPEDEIAREILQTCFPDREILGFDARDIVWGGGSFHCLSQQEPASL